ncbi:MAG: Rrf2 family transcriptional regulator [Phycisphaerales bacterium]|nr:Rrf2 family transcriptional regulator [Phycisphaerales bacterium]MCB9835814.1 Rrf2 family transcriptional regulator [Phycisphaera sp.]
MLTQTSEYALRAMCALASRPGETVPAAELATQAGVPPPYLAKIMQQLAATNFVSGRRGIGGGYALSVDPERVTALEVVMAVGPIRKPRTAAELNELGDGFKALHERLDRAASGVLSVLQESTIAEIAQDLSAITREEQVLSVQPASNGTPRSAAG